MSTLVYYQQQSLLFRLPREIRNQIYKQYVCEEDGYYYDFTCARLRRKASLVSTSDEHKAICLDLAYTCKIAADEMKGVPLRTNKITFTTAGHREGDMGSHRGLQSKAGRFRCLLKYVQDTKILIILHVAELITPQMVRRLEELYPSISHYFGEPLRTAYTVARQHEEAQNVWRPILEDATDVVLSANFNDGLQYMLELVRSQDPNQFDKLASEAFGERPSFLKACGLGNSDLARDWPWRHFFVKGSLDALLSWNPKSWDIPSEEELCDLERRLTEPRTPAQISAWIDKQDLWLLAYPEIDMFRESQGTRWHFSAAAVAIDFLRNASPAQRLEVRHIELHEDLKSLYYPASHARGLIPFIQENRNLRISRHIGVLNNMLPQGWSGLENRPDATSNWVFDGDMIISAFAEWLEEASFLSTSPIPSGAFTLVIECTTEEGAQAWEILKQAASLQEAMLESIRSGRLQAQPLVSDPCFDEYSYPLPCHLPASFAETVRAIIEGHSLVKVRGYVGAMWDVDELVCARKDWNADLWRHEWKQDILHKCHATTERNRDLRSRYRL